jgi:hypothetical protein
MNVASSMAIALAERVEKSAGPKAGLLAWKTLADTSSPGDTRARALLAAMRCALAAGEFSEMNALTQAWEFAGPAPFDREVAAIVKGLARSRLLAPATALAAVELLRRRSAFSLYLHARCLDVANDARAHDAFGEAVRRAEEEGAAAEPIARAARLRRLARSPDPDEAAKLDLGKLAPRDRIIVARALLRSPSRFTRAGAIAALDGLVASGDVPIAKGALAVAGAHVDDAADLLTPLEIDRLLALFGREVAVGLAPRGRDLVKAAASVAHAATDAELDAALAEAAKIDASLAANHRRAREILGGRVEPAATPPAKDPAGLVLDAFSALREDQTTRAATALVALGDAEERGIRVPAEAWNVARLGLESEHLAVNAAAARLVTAKMRSRRGGPPRGWLEIAAVLSARGLHDLADRARRHAVATKEPGAEDALVFALTRAGWEHARRGEREKALARLREAKALASKQKA